MEKGKKPTFHELDKILRDVGFETYEFSNSRLLYRKETVEAKVYASPISYVITLLKNHSASAETIRRSLGNKGIVCDLETSRRSINLYVPTKFE